MAHSKPLGAPTARQSDRLPAPDLIANLGSHFWDDCRQQLTTLLSDGFPSASSLNLSIPTGLTNHIGKAIRFVSSEAMLAAHYEQHIFDEGEISTRPDSWHDLFNALAWMQFPAIKSALNAQHCGPLNLSKETGRGKQRDALTLFDECGVIVVSTDLAALEAIADHDWNEVFSGGITRWAATFRVLVIGHAMREKLLSPYKAMTANALLVHLPDTMFYAPVAELIDDLDAALAGLLRPGQLLQSPAELAPLPLMGIPGWWPDGEQDAGFYADRQVFRAKAAGREPGRILQLT